MASSWKSTKLQREEEAFLDTKGDCAAPKPWWARRIALRDTPCNGRSALVKLALPLVHERGRFRAYCARGHQPLDQPPLPPPVVGAVALPAVHIPVRQLAA
eukprot:7377899-Prymnesium_polylepis.1